MASILSLNIIEYQIQNTCSNFFSIFSLVIDIRLLKPPLIFSLFKILVDIMIFLLANIIFDIAQVFCFILIFIFFCYFCSIDPSD